MPFETFDLGRVLQTAEAIKGMRNHSITEKLQQQYLGSQIRANDQKTQQDAAVFDEKQQIENTRLLNSAMAEISQNVNAADRWAPLLKERGVINADFDWRSRPPEEIQAGAKQMFDSTSQALKAYNQSSKSTGLVQSTFQGGNGNAWVMTRDGRAVDTGVPMQKFSPQAVEVGGGLSVYDPNQREVAGQIATPQQQIGAAATQAGAEQAAREQAKIEAIPKQAAAERQAAAPQRAEKVRQITSGIDSTMQEVDKALGTASFWTTGVMAKMTNAVPGTPAYDLSQTLLTVRANLGFDRLQAMRDASPTGGALGQVAVQELQSLQATVASLDQLQSEPQLRAALRKIQTHYTNWREAVVEANRDVASPQGGKAIESGWTIEEVH